MTPLLAPDPALDAYESLAPFYDEFTASYDHERWLANIESLALALGLTGRRLLDVGCGTGKSFVPMVRRGYEVTACDLSPAMAEVARGRAGCEAVDVVTADMRDLPELGLFDLATCLDDGLNYLLSAEDLTKTFAGVERNLREGGLFVFDLNSLATYRREFASQALVEREDSVFSWLGGGRSDAEPGAVSSALIEVFSREGGERRLRARSRHVQRHHPPELVKASLREAGLELAEVRGQVTGARLEAAPADGRHVKLVYFARKPHAARAHRAQRKEVLAC